MKYNPAKHHRHSIRLNSYDYSSAGAYFITTCTRRRECLFGCIQQGSFLSNEAGDIVSNTWKSLSSRFPSLVIDTFVLMPNHFHGIIVLNQPIQIVGAGLAPPSRATAIPNKGAASSAPTLGDVVRAFKSISAIAVNRLLDRQGWPLWQRNYYEHIIRDDDDLLKIREYITLNPVRWDEDEENPTRANDS